MCIRDRPVDDYMVEVITAEVGVAVGRFHFEHSVAEFEDGDIECAAAEVKHGDLLVFVAFVEAVGECGCGGFVDDTLDCEAGDFACFLGGLALGAVSYTHLDVYKRQVFVQLTFVYEKKWSVTGWATLHLYGFRYF